MNTFLEKVSAIIGVEMSVLMAISNLYILYFRLYKEGHTVVGVEAVEQGINEFFSEHNLPCIIEQLSWAKVFKVRDFFRFPLRCCR